jgi:parallel beta-helix repeat protein
MKKTLVLAMAAVWCLARVAAGAEYHVAQKNPAADDANPGTAEKPLKTINAALPKMKPGDALFVRAGVYREAVTLTNKSLSGTAGSPTRFVAWPGDEVVVKGSDVVAGWQPYTNAVWAKADWPHYPWVFCDGQPLEEIGSDPKHMWAQTRKGGDKGLTDMKAGSFHYDVTNKQMYVWLADGSDPNAHVLEVAQPRAGIVVDGAHIEIAGFKVINASLSLGGSYNMAADCEVTWSTFCGIGVGGRNNTVLRCKSNHNGNTGMSTFGSGHRVVDCETSFNNWQRWDTPERGGPGHSGGMKNFSSDTIIRGCIAEGNICSDGIWFDGFPVNVTIENCRSFRNDANGIFHEICERATIQNNICYENKGSGIYIPSSAYCHVMHNVCYRNGMAGIAVVGIDRFGGQSGEESGYLPGGYNVVWGNVLMDNCHPDLCPKEKDHTGNTWEKRPELMLPDPGLMKSNEGNISDYNLFWRSDGRAMNFWYGFDSRPFADLRQWQTQTGHDRHSVVAEPKFRDLARYDFHPAAGSPAIRMVRPRRGAWEDLEGKPRMFGGYYSVYHTAGPYEAEWPLVPPKTASGYLLVDFPSLRFREQHHATLTNGWFNYVWTDAGLAAVRDATATTRQALKDLPLETLAEGQKGFRLKGIPFQWPAEPLVLAKGVTSDRGWAGVGRLAKKLYFAQVVLGAQGTNAASHHCEIRRLDRHAEGDKAKDLKWEWGQNIGPSLGKWEGMAVGTAEGVKTEVGWQSADGKARVFLTSWENDNPKSPLADLQWGLDDPAATVIVLGVTAEP